MSPVGQINVAARSVSRADRASSQRGPRTPAGNVNDARRSKSAAERRYRQRTKRTLVPARLQESAQVPTAPRPGRRKTPRVDCAGCRRDRRHGRIRQRKTATRSPVAQGEALGRVCSPLDGVVATRIRGAWQRALHLPVTTLPSLALPHPIVPQIAARPPVPKTVVRTERRAPTGEIA